MTEPLGSSPIILFALLALWITWVIFVRIPYDMALARNRGGIAWVIISLITSPFLAILLLLILGNRK